ncbi:MAG: hypothetical protein ACUVR4_13265 [Anaerolineae bacterium]
MAPQTARGERDGRELEILIAAVRIGEVVSVRPGEKIPLIFFPRGAQLGMGLAYGDGSPLSQCRPIVAG